MIIILEVALQWFFWFIIILHFVIRIFLLSKFMFLRTVQLIEFIFFILASNFLILRIFALYFGLCNLKIQFSVGRARILFFINCIFSIFFFLFSFYKIFQFPYFHIISQCIKIIVKIIHLIWILFLLFLLSKIVINFTNIIINLLII